MRLVTTPLIDSEWRAGGVLRTGQALRAGIHPRDLYALREAGVLEAVSRGVYRLAELPPLVEPDLFAVAARVPKAVIAVISALHFHRLTTEIPHAVSIALPRGSSRPRLEWPPLRVYWFSGAMYTEGIETHELDGVTLKVYGAARTVADCFRLRNRLGIDVAVEALRTGLEERKFTPAEILRVARTCRVARVVRPYLEALQCRGRGKVRRVSRTGSSGFSRRESGSRCWHHQHRHTSFPKT